MDVLWTCCKPVIAERFRFHKRNQGEEETVAQYVAVLKRLSEYCEFGAYLEDALRDRFVCGLKSETVQKRLLTEKDLTFHKAVEYAVSAETATRDVQQLSGSLKVHAMISQKGDQCRRCGKMNHRDEDCWYKDRDYYQCGKKGACVRVKPEAAKPEAAKTENGNRKVIQRREFIMWMLEMLVKVMRLNLTLTLSWDCIPCLKKGNIPESLCCLE